MSKESKNKATVKKIFSADYAEGLEPVIKKFKAEMFSPVCVFHGPEGDQNVDDFFIGIMALYKAFPDAKFTLEDSMAEGDKTTERYTMTGTHRGEFMGVPATGKKIKTGGMAVRRFSGGKIVEAWFMMDSLGLLQQLGIRIPTR